MAGARVWLRRDRHRYRPAPTGKSAPRIFRYAAQRALINRLGFNNEGAAAVAARLRKLRDSSRPPSIPIGVNLGKSKVTPLDEAPADYLYSFRQLHPWPITSCST